MKKTFKRILALFLSLLMLFSAASCALTPSNNGSNEKIPEAQGTQLSNSQDSDKQSLQLFDQLSGLMNADDHLIKNIEGNFTVPFDVAYPEAFEAGAFQYDPSVLLLKMDSEFDGQMTSEIEACGFDALEEFCAVVSGTWYRATLSEGTVITEAAAKARELDSIITVDYDYLSEKASDGEIELLNDSVKDNPRVNEQWYLDSCHIQETWQHLAEEGLNPGGSSSVIVAVIDTGVDYTHPDLSSSMWINKGEIPGNGIDDDGNGYKDDIHGCSTIGSSYDHSGNPMDDHGHGTHVAGIIGAANNKEGIVGIAYNVKIMAVKAGQASGMFNQSDIAEAILYAYENGAEVINMSFGGSACSLAVQEALELAWTRAVLVAAAGNEGVPNEDWGENGTNIVHYGRPSYPAAFNFVIGVMSVNRLNMESIFTNWDAFDSNSVEYEVYAPGEDILSTLPGGKYGYLSGTSMAAPVVSAIAALLRTKFTDRDMYPAKFIDGQICSTSEEYSICWDPTHSRGHNVQQLVDAYSALTKMPKPDLYLYDWYIFDDPSISSENNGDGFIDAGETLYIAPILYNQWGMSKDTVVTIDAIGSLGIENPYVEIITASSDFEGVGTYSIKDQLIRNDNGLVIGADEPLIVKIKDDCPNDYYIRLEVTITYKNGLNENDVTVYKKSSRDIYHPISAISFTARNGAKFPNVIDKDTVITNDKYYILDGTCTIFKDVTLTIEEGVQIQTTDYTSIKCYGTLITQGTDSNRVQIIAENRCNIQEYDGEIYLNYTTLDGSFSIECTELNSCNCLFERISPQSSSYSDRVFSKVITNSYIEYGDIEASIIQKSQIYRSEVFADVVKDSIIEGCSYSYRDDHRGNYYANWTENCVLYDDNIDALAYKSVFKNCIIMGSDDIGDNQNIYYLHSNIAKEQITGFIQNPSTNTTYIRVSNIDINDTAYIKKLETDLGGKISCVETLEEYNYLWNNQLYGYYGARYNENVWVNGTPIGDWLYVTEVPNQCLNKAYVSMYDRFAPTYINGGLEDEVEDKPYMIYGLAEKDGLNYVPPSHGFVFEVPDINITVEKANEIVGNCPNERTYCLYNCAIINNFNEPDSWFLVHSSPNYDYEDCRTINLSNIYWGTTDIELIEAQILDFDDEPYLRDQIDPSGFLTEAPSDAYPFVVDAYVLNQNGERVRTVNNETVTFVVEFNRDMDTSVPLKVTFGSSAEYFYEDYNISEYGKWVTPRRWEATYTLKTIIENGNHTIKIENGCAADDEWLKLFDIPGRFMFEIDTTAAQALIMQGHATETGIQLSWMQDDYDTLMGYNVYRSEREDGYYQRLNSSVIPFDTKEFFDDTVEPGKVYYYNFTVVKTDLTESEPSGKISLMSMDTMAPNIYHSPVYSGYLGSNLIVGATVTDNLGLKEVKLYYRAVGASEWRSLTMSVLNNRYTGLIAADFLSADGIEYYICAYDGINYTYKGSADSPFIVAIQAAVDSSSLGDVDGDGIITNKDALMLLQAANDLLNLTEEQFLRADIDGNKELSASEALRILQYVSGKVTTIVG